jgi:hypothetical protein
MSKLLRKAVSRRDAFMHHGSKSPENGSETGLNLFYVMATYYGLLVIPKVHVKQLIILETEAIHCSCSL